MTGSTLLAGVAAGAGLLVWTGAGGSRSRLRRVVRARRTVAEAVPQRSWPPAGLVRETAPAALALVAAVAFLTAPAAVAWPAGAVVMVLAARWVRGRREAARSTRIGRAEVAAVPGAIDLLVACLDAGIWPVEALEAVAEAVGGPLGGRLQQVAAAQRLGAEATEAWGSLARGDPLAPVARALCRASVTGAPLSVTLGLVAEEARRRRRWAAEAGARRAGVLAVGPLVACFLPAFVLLGVVPVVLGVATEVLGDLR